MPPLPTPPLRFVNYRKVVGADYKNPEIWSRAWLRREDFSDAERLQLQDILAEWDIAGDPFTIPCGDFQGLAEVGFELWDVVDSANRPAYTIWSYTDSGMIYAFGAAERLGQIIQWGAEFDDDNIKSMLLDAYRAERKSHPDANLPESLSRE